MKMKYIQPITETVSPATEGLLYTTSPEYGGTGGGAPEAKKQEFAYEEDEEPQDDTLPKFSIWDD